MSLEVTPENSIPVIARARGYRLYDHRGGRYLDLSLAGTAVLGHRPGGVNLQIKNTLARGLVSPMPSVYPARLRKQLLRRYPDFACAHLAATRAEALWLAARYLRQGVEEVGVADPAVGGSGPLIVDRPFLPEPLRARAVAEAQVVLPELPFQLHGVPSPVLFRDAVEIPEQQLSPVLVAGMLRSLHDLDAHELPSWYREDLLAGAPSWVQRGIYVSPSFPAEEYPPVFRRFLEAGVLLSPSPQRASILPGEASPGELAGLLKLFGEVV